jgi:hypothetical protein
MTMTKRSGGIRKRIGQVAMVGAVTMIGLVACAAVAHQALMGSNPVPAASEFGYGPRTSAGGSFTATLGGAQPYRKGRLFSTGVSLVDAQGSPLTGARVAVAGGMPQHGHGLPTQPRVTAETAPGTYRIDGLKFNMGGWWELKLRVETSSAADSVVFNLNL